MLAGLAVKSNVLYKKEKMPHFVLFPFNTYYIKIEKTALPFFLSSTTFTILIHLLFNQNEKVSICVSFHCQNASIETSNCIGRKVSVKERQ